MGTHERVVIDGRTDGCVVMEGVGDLTDLALSRQNVGNRHCDSPNHQGLDHRGWRHDCDAFDVVPIKHFGKSAKHVDAISKWTSFVNSTSHCMNSHCGNDFLVRL